MSYSLAITFAIIIVAILAESEYKPKTTTTTIETTTTTTITTTKKAESCPHGWSYYNKFCYFMNETGATQSQAEECCQSKGAHLVSIHSAEENKFVINLIRNSDAVKIYKQWTYMGMILVWPASGNPPPIKATYTDGTKVDYGNPVCWPRGMQPWNGYNCSCEGIPPPEPNNFNGESNCVVWNHGGWADTLCNSTFPFVCKKAAATKKAAYE